MKKKKKDDFVNADACLEIADPPIKDVFYPCDYCGGRTRRTKAYPGEEIGIQFDMPQIGIHMKCCMWCWKKVFDVVLGKSAGKEKE